MATLDSNAISGLLSFSVPLVPFVPANEENGFRVQNTSLEDWQREAVIERTGAVDVRCDLVGVLHGWCDEESDDGPFATLLVFKFRFDPQKHARRIIRCTATVDFSSMVAGGARPEVTAIAPYDKFEMVPTKDPADEKTTFNASLTLSGLPFVGGTIGGSFEKARRRDNSDATTVSGNISLPPGTNSGKRSCAVWTLLENATQSSGLPDSLRVALVLKRQDNEPFQGMARMTCRADFLTGLGWFFGSFPIDDPVLFNPALKEPQGILRGYSGEHITSIDLQRLADVAFRTEYEGAVKKVVGRA